MRCPNCGLTGYSAPSYASASTCPECCARLTAAARLFHDFSTDRPDLVRRSLVADTTAPARARRAVTELAVAMPAAWLEDVRLMVSELVTNALQHGAHRGSHPIDLQMEMGGDDLYVAVSDGGPGFEPALVEPGSDVSRGRGLLIVDRLADRWGVRPGPPTAVWFELLAAGRTTGLPATA